MRINNETHWRTDDIKKMLAACIEHEGLDLRFWRIRIYYTRRRNNVMGYAYYDSHTFKIGLPRRIHVADGKKQGTAHPGHWTDPDELPADVIKRFAQVTIHEIGHCKGLHHVDMPRSSKINVDFAEGFVVRKLASAKPQPKADRETKAREALDRLDDLIEKEEKRHTKAMKALKTRRGKARSSVRYYDKKAADK